MKKITVTMIALCIALVSGATLAKSSRVDVLHKPGTAAERTITISVSALPAHCRHGDEVVGDDFSCDGGGGDELLLVCHIDEFGDVTHNVEVFASDLDGYTTEHEGDSHGVFLENDCPFVGA